MEMIKVIRYSKEGFKPQHQDNHLKHIDYMLNKFNLKDYPEHLQYELQKIHDKAVPFYTEHLSDFQSGIWCFIDGHKCNQSLNHLKEKVPCWEAEIPTDIMVYDCNWEYLIPVTDSRVHWGGFYLPEKYICKLENKKRRKGGKISGK